MKCLIFDPFCGATETMVLGAMLGCGADEWRVRSAVEGFCDAPLDVQDRQNGHMASKVAEINLAGARKQYKDMSRDEALARLNVAHENQPVRVDAMNIVKKMFDAEESLYGPGAKISIYMTGLILGICTAYDSLERPAVQSTPVAMGGGIMEVDGRQMPVPRPETLEIIKESKLIAQGGPFDGELLTVGRGGSASLLRPVVQPVLSGEQASRRRIWQAASLNCPCLMFCVLHFARRTRR